MTTLTIQNLKTVETYGLVNDVCHEHPAWVHEQIGTTNESDLQWYLAGLSYEFYERTSPEPDDMGIFMSETDANDWFTWDEPSVFEGRG